MQQANRSIYIAAAVLAAACILIIITVAGCLRASPPLPTGVQTVRGVLERADISLSRSGTHKLLVGDVPVYFVESSLVNLRVHEGREAQFQGTLVSNIDPRALPVLVVTAVIGGASEETRSWTVPSLDISLSVPRSWRGVIEGSATTFTASGSLRPLLTVRSEQMDALPFDFRTLKAGSGGGLTVSPLVVANRKAVSVLQEQKGLYAVYVEAIPRASSSGTDADTAVITLTFTLREPGSRTAQMADALTVAQSLRFTSAPAPSSVRRSSSGAAGSLSSGSVASPCGGPAGILCPSGFYCSITDRENDIGVCRAI